MDPKLLTDASFIPNLSRSTIQLDHPIVLDALGQVLVRSADVYPRNFGELAKRQGRSRESVVGLEFDHWPDYNPHGLERLFKQRELSKETRIDTLARLVPGPEIIAKGLDDMVRRDADMGNSRFKHPSNASQHSACRGDLLTPAVRMWGHSVEMAKQLVSAIYKIDVQTLHDPKERCSSVGCVLGKKA